MGGLCSSKHLFHIFILFVATEVTYSLRKYDRKGLQNLREEVREMFQHAYNSYLKYAYPYDELRPLSCDGVDTWGSYSLTLIDALDTLAVMGNFSEFQRVVDIIATKASFDANINVSVFETNIRIIGGLLSAHLLSYRAGVSVEPGWPCNGPLLRLAEDVAQRLIAAFDTATGMPYGTVNLRYGVPHGETSITCTAGVGTFIVEFGTLSRLTGDPLYEEVAMNALNALYHHRSPIGLVGNHIDVQTGRWTAQDAGIGAGVDSYYEYLVKGAILLQRPELMHTFHKGREAIDKYLKRDDWHLWVSMTKGQVTLPVFQSLEAYWPGVLSLIGDVSKAMKSLHNYHQVWKQYGFTPEYYNIPQGEAGTNREGYPLRPELVESVMYLYRATGDPYLLEVGEDILRSIQHSAHTPCGYATIKDVRDHRKEDRMESFFLAETTKYLYLLFDPDNFIHNQGQHGKIINTPWGECVIEAGGYVFNTEAHPIDPGALHCCSGHRQDDIQAMLSSLGSGSLKGELLSTTHHVWKTSQHHKQRTSVTKEAPQGIDLDEKIPAPVKSDPGKENEDSEFKKRLSYLEKLATEMGDAIDVVQVSAQEIETVSEQPAKEKPSAAEETDKTVPNSSIFDNLSEDFPIEHPSDAPLPKEGESNKSKSGNATSGSASSVLEYRADDSDQVYYVIDGEDSVVRKESSSQQVNLSVESSEDDVDQENMDINDSPLSQLISEKNTEGERPVGPEHMTVQFDPQALLERLRKEAKFSTNSTWEQDYQLLSCPAQPFLQRLAMSGEIFGAS